MPTQAQIDANRRNAQKSSGPCTDAGKARSRWNALKFGIDAKSIVLPCEDPAEFDELRQELLDRHQPSTVTQLAYVDIIAVALWKHRRYQRAEQQEFAVEHLRQKECDWYKPAFPLAYPSLAGKTFVILRRAAEEAAPILDAAEPEAATSAPPPNSPERTQTAPPEPPPPPAIAPHPIPPDSEAAPDSPERRVA